MGKYINKPSIIIALAIVFCLFTSCTNHDTDANKRHTESFVNNNISNIQSVCNYLLDSEYDLVSIDKADGQMFASSATINAKIKIDDPEIIDSLKSLFDAGCKHIILSRRYTGIAFRLGQVLIGDYEFGFAYPLSDDSDEMVQYQTESIPINNTDYYYYESDYEEWRTLNK